MTKIKILIDNVEEIVFDVVSEIGLSETTLPSFPAVLGVYFKNDEIRTATTLSALIPNSLVIKNLTVDNFGEKFDIIKDAVSGSKPISVKLFNNESLYEEIIDIKSVCYSLFIFETRCGERIFLSNTKLINSELGGDE